MARTKRYNTNIMTREEFLRVKQEYPNWLPKILTYEQYVAESVSDKVTREQPPATFRKMLNRQSRAKQNQALRSQLAHGEEDPVLPLSKRNLRWLWF